MPCILHTFDRVLRRTISNAERAAPVNSISAIKHEIVLGGLLLARFYQLSTRWSTIFMYDISGN